MSIVDERYGGTFDENDVNAALPPEDNAANDDEDHTIETAQYRIAFKRCVCVGVLIIFSWQLPSAIYGALSELEGGGATCGSVGVQEGFPSFCANQNLVVGFGNATISSVCCANVFPSNFTELGIQVVPFVPFKYSRIKEIVTNSALLDLYLDSCPHLVGNIPAQGFAGTMLSAVIGTIVMIVLNSVATLDWCCGPEDDDGYNEEVPRPMRLSKLALLKTTVFLLVGYGLAVVNTVKKSKGPGWGSNFNIFFSLIVHGSVLQSIIDLIAFVVGTVAVAKLFVPIDAIEVDDVSTTSLLPRERGAATVSTKRRKRSEHAGLWRHIPPRWVLVIASCLPLIPVLFTHIIPGLFLYFTVAVVFTLLVVAVAGVLALPFKLCNSKARFISTSIVCIVCLNVCLTLIGRFGFNMMAFIYRYSSYSYKGSGLWGSNWLEMPFYHIQTSSDTCSLLHAFHDAPLTADWFLMVL